MKVLVKETLSQHKFKDANGYLICTDCILARTGKQTYRKDEVFTTDDSSEIDVDRPYEEVFDSRTLASFENVPLCKDHPNEDVTPENHNSYSVGFVRNIRQGKDNGLDVIIGDLVITDSDVINLVENGEYCELSCGYNTDIIGDDKVGYKQTNIRGNHVALCECGRAGNARIVDSMKDSQITSYKGYIFNEYNEVVPLFVGFTKDKEIQKIREDYIVYVKNSSHGDLYNIIKDVYGPEAFTVIVEPGKITITKLKKYSQYGVDLVKAAKQIENTNNIIWDSIKDDLIQSASKEAFKKNVETEIEAGKDPKQALAIAYSIQRENDSDEVIKDELYSLQELREMRIGNYKESDIYKVNGKYSTNPNTSKERFNSLEEVKKYIDNKYSKDSLASTNEEVTKSLEKNLKNFEDSSDLSLLKEYYAETQPNKKMELRHKLREMGLKEGVSGVYSRELMWIELNGKRYEVKNLRNVRALDSKPDLIKIFKIAKNLVR